MTVDNLTIQNCELAFQCPKTWDSLRDRGDPWKRFCPQCKRRVYLVATDEELRVRVLSGECVAIDRNVKDGLIDVQNLHLGEALVDSK